MHKKVCVAMSGGVDSTTTAHLLKREGYEVFGLTMYLFDVIQADGSLGPPAFLQDAKKAAEELGIEHDIVDLRDIFKTTIIEPFVEAYLRGETPNPCALCNAQIKYGRFMDEALSRGADYMATGHYVNLVRHGQDGLIHLHEGHTFRKDQSFFLHGVKQEKLERLLLPLGKFSSKDETRALAKAFESQLAEKKDSLGICFTQGKLPFDYIRERVGQDFGHGRVLDLEGRVVGSHDGYFQFTLGQKKGFVLADAFKASHKDLAVCEIVPASGDIVIGPETALMGYGLEMADCHWIHEPQLPWQGEFKIFVWGYRLKGTLSRKDSGSYELWFDQPVRAIALGQSCVAYLGDEVLGGGRITGIMKDLPV